MLWTLVVVFSLLCAVCEQAWVIEPSAFTVYRTKHTWNEARLICENNNNTLLTIPDEHYWTFWKFVLNPESEAFHRNIDNSRYWFGLHAPDPSNMTSLLWADCVVPSWIEWTSNGRNYVPDHPCLAFDVYFKPFTTILLKIWLADTCSMDNYFVCSEPLSVAADTCIAHGCDEQVRVVNNSNECQNMCMTDPQCRTNFTLISGVGLCHVFYLTTYKNSAFYRMCVLQGSGTIPTCPNNNGFGDTGNIINVDPDPAGICLALETTSAPPTSTVDITSTRETTTADVIVTTEVSRPSTTTPQHMCVCACNTDNTPVLTIEEKVEQLKKELTINKKNTSLHKRKFISASDDRMSATGIGSFGVAMLATVLLSICIMDLGTLKADLHNMYRNVRSCCCKNKKETRVRHVRHVDPSIAKVKLFTGSGCPVVVSAATSPVTQKPKAEDVALQRNGMMMLSVPTINEGSESSMRSRSYSKRTGADRSSNISPGYNSSLSTQSSNASGNVNVSRKSSARSSGMSSMNDHSRSRGSDIQLCHLSSDDREGNMLPNRIQTSDLRGSNTQDRNNSKEPKWLRMV